MKKVLLLTLVVIPFFLFGQEIKLSSGTGYTIIKTTTMKKNALGTSTMIGAEFILKEFWYLNTMIGIQTTKFDYSLSHDTSIYVSKYYLSLPVSIKNYYPVSKKSSLFIDIGACFSYNFSTRNEVFTAGTYYKINNNNAGLNIGAIVDIGFKTQITRKVYFDVNINDLVDIVAFYKNDTDKVKNNRRMLSLTLYRKLK
ncbi:MAG: hypothetical protein IPP72_15100 [Chitinophagaceae bacterium]|nr:hypothetical protein [Chitinophagaceae bacterium]